MHILSPLHGLKFEHHKIVTIIEVSNLKVQYPNMQLKGFTIEVYNL